MGHVFGTNVLRIRVSYMLCVCSCCRMPGRFYSSISGFNFWLITVSLEQARWLYKAQAHIFWRLDS